MKLMAKNGWLLSEGTSKALLQVFDGTKEELVAYVASEPLSSGVISKTDKGMLIVKPRCYIGIYDLIPDEKGIFARG